MADIDVGQISEALNAKVDLPSGKSQSDVKQVIAAYINGTSGYRIWSDGYCEQWGSITQTSSGVTYSVSFAKTFANTNYNMQVTAGYNNYSESGVNYNYNKTTTSCGIIGINVSGYTTDWCARGYLASGQY